MHPLIAVPATLALVVRAYRRKSLTSTGIIWATATATVHALHPSPVPFTLLVLFFLLGTSATKVKHDIKATLTVSSSGSAGGEGPRTSIQVLANSAIASSLCLLHVFKYGLGGPKPSKCFGEGGASDLVLIGIVSNYAAVTADTLSSELGILSKSRPRLITTLRSVPPGTNGGVTPTGILAGFAGSVIIGLVSVTLLDFCDIKGETYVWSSLYTSTIGHRRNETWHLSERFGFWVAVTIWGTLGSLLDSWLGAVLQASVVDRRTGKVIEGDGGRKVLVTKKRTAPDGGKTKEVSRSIGSGRDVLDNNQINLLMAFLMTTGGILVGAGLTKQSLAA